MTPTTKMKTKEIAKLRSRNSLRIDEALLGRERVDEEDIEGGGRHDRLDEDLAGGEPVELLAAVEEDLERADGEAERAEAEPIELGR